MANDKGPQSLTPTNTLDGGGEHDHIHSTKRLPSREGTSTKRERLLSTARIKSSQNRIILQEQFREEPRERYRRSMPADTTSEVNLKREHQ
jgi:hypothetical protein